MKSILFILLLVCQFSAAQTPKVVMLNYDEIYQFEDGFALTLKDRKYGIINSNLDVIIPPILDDVHCSDYSPYYFNNQLFGDLDSITVIYDTLGNIVKKYDRLVPIEETHPYPLLNQARKTGPYTIRTGSNLYYYFGSSDWGCIHENGDTIVPFNYNGVVSGCTNSSFIAYERNKGEYRFKFYYPTGSNDKFYYGKMFGWPKGDCFWRQTEKGLAAYNSNLELVDSNSYEWVYVYENMCWAKKQGYCYAINSNFEITDTIQCDNFIQNKYWGAAKQDGKFAIFNAEGVQKTDFIYEGTVSQFMANSPKILVKDSTYYFVLNAQGQVLKKFTLKRTFD